jgi:hypothetical protein
MLGDGEEYWSTARQPGPRKARARDVSVRHLSTLLS